VAVAVTESVAEPVTQFYVAEGQALPDRETLIRAETSGQIAEVTARKGTRLEAGAEIARFEIAQRQAQLAEARADLERAQQDFGNAEQLLNRGVSTATRVSEARAALAAAEAALAENEELLDNIVLRAPFAGLLDDLTIDPGEYVSTGTDIGRIIDTDPLTIEVQVPQQTVGRVSAGQTAEVLFITGEVRDGRVTYVSGSADAETRTFRAEVEVANFDGAIPAGISARLRVPTGEAVAHFISPAILSLGTDGALGVKTVTDSGRRLQPG
jgi:multidrug efflux system membrane fusion protein